jgi:phosphorylcholine metabolism protein LicD
MAGNLKLTGKIEITARKMLKDVCRILDENEIPYTLEGGTLLGIIRENRLLPWDNDMDLTIADDHLEKLVKIRYKFWLAGYRTRIRKIKKRYASFSQRLGKAC